MTKSGLNPTSKTFSTTTRILPGVMLKPLQIRDEIPLFQVSSPLEVCSATSNFLESISARIDAVLVFALTPVISIVFMPESLESFLSIFPTIS